MSPRTTSARCLSYSELSPLLPLTPRRRWGQIDMPSKAAAREAIDMLNGQNLKGLDMVVEEMADRPSTRPARQAPQGPTALALTRTTELAG